MAEKKATDWERIEADYRAGLLSVREIAAANGVSHVAVMKRAKKDGWERDLSARIKARAEALVTSRQVTAEVTAERLVTDRALVEANAEVIAGVRLSHRKDISTARTLAMSLLDELTHQTGNADLYEQLAELLIDTGDDEKDSAAATKRWQAFNAAMSLGGRTKVMKDLADTLHKLIGLEREAYGLVEAKKLEVTGKDGKPLGSKELSDDELTAIAAGQTANG
ncbi:hypothetical protein [Luteibacter sp. SG786]|uniref:hypothetical protein n=1 Tax=Luteibacter sp. SG786 TaxID=2587130 RepID=UPI001ABABF99|nr:hypothetical protein [Luteibacter sp. SG786]NII54388.1 hypothetical protein [Luteibacter sp. SG786]